eukprot:COSAG01_NODE_2976_length_6765_cov_22.300480_3_plen_170_part_00
MMRNKDAQAFLAPVDQLWPRESLPGYFDLIMRPMDLGSIKSQLERGQYSDNPAKFAADVRLVFQNCMTYNQPGTNIYQQAARMRSLFDEAYEKLKLLASAFIISTAQASGGAPASSGAAAAAAAGGSRADEPAAKRQRAGGALESTRSIDPQQTAAAFSRTFSGVRSGN